MKKKLPFLPLCAMVCSHCTLVLLLLLPLAAFAQIPADTLYINSDKNYPLSEHLYVLEKTEKVAASKIAWSEPAAAFKKLYPKQVLDIGIAKSYFWLVFTVKNNTPTDAVYNLQLHYPGANYINVYAKSANNINLIGKAGIRLTVKDKAYNNYDPVFPLPLRAGQAATYLVMVDKLGESLNIWPTLKGHGTFQNGEKYLYTLYGLIAGIMLTNIIVNLFLFVSLKQKIHLQYSLYVLVILCWIFDGFCYRIFLYNYPSITAISEFITTSVGLIIMTYLIITFLGLNKQNCRFLRLIITIRYILMLLIPLSYIAFIIYGHLVWPKEAYLYAMLSAAALAVLLFIASAIESAWQRNRLAWFYLASVSYLGFSILQYILYLLGYNENNRMYMHPNDIQIGVLIETTIIFLGIIYRYNLYKKEKGLLMAKINQQQQETAHQVIEAQEEERRRLAQDLHDDVGATLSTLLLHVSNLDEYKLLDRQMLLQHKEKSVAISKKALADLRLISHNLLPKDFSGLGIFAILKKMVNELNSLGLINFVLLTSGNDRSIDPKISITIYRITNELINNVIKHAMASHCTIELVMCNDNLLLIIEDNGIGIGNSGNSSGIGLRNIKSRVKFLQGFLNIDGNGKGTSIIIEIPINTNNDGK